MTTSKLASLRCGRFNALSLTPRAQDRELFDRFLRSFVPEKTIDIHAHFYRLDDIQDVSVAASDDAVGLDVYREQMSAWMGDRAPLGGLFFPFPVRGMDVDQRNTFCIREAAQSCSSRALILVRPEDDEQLIAGLIEEYSENIAGFKVYHVFADRCDTLNAKIAEFLPEWVWEIADQRRLLIMLHLVRSRALADPLNQRYIRQHCTKYSGARLILAHAGRGFCSLHTVEGIDALRGLDNVYFDTSAICEPTAIVSVLQEFGPKRLLFGTDFPVCNHRGRCTSLGDGFYWLGENDTNCHDFQFGPLTLVGIESLLAIKQASQLSHLTDDDIEHVFWGNAAELLGFRDTASERNHRAYSRARQIVPGGTQLLSKRPEMYAPNRWPPYFSEARGVRVVDLEGREYIDMSTMSVGACLLGYADPDVNSAVHRRVGRGSMASLNSDDEVTLAELLLEIHPWAGKVRYARGGGEAMAVAVRIARAHTRRSKIAFCGYHGWHDWYLAANYPVNGLTDQLSGHLLAGLEPAGVPIELAGTAKSSEYNQLEQLEVIAHKHGDELAAIVVEPTRSCEPVEGFLEGVRELAVRIGAVLIFDEVSVGWRLCLGGAHLRYHVAPDIAVYSKAIANGYPMAAIVGADSVMHAAEQTFISSTMWSDGIGPAAAIATIRKFQRIDVPQHVAAIGAKYCQGIGAVASRHGVPIRFRGHAALLMLSFDHAQASELQTLLTTRMLDCGYLVGAAFYPSLAHEERHVDACVASAESAFEELGNAIRMDDVKERLDGPIKHCGFGRLA